MRPLGAPAGLGSLVGVCIAPCNATPMHGGGPALQAGASKQCGPTQRGPHLGSGEVEDALLPGHSARAQHMAARKAAQQHTWEVLQAPPLYMLLWACKPAVGPEYCVMQILRHAQCSKEGPSCLARCAPEDEVWEDGDPGQRAAVLPEAHHRNVGEERCQQGVEDLRHKHLDAREQATRALHWACGLGLAHGGSHDSSGGACQRAAGSRQPTPVPNG